MSKRGLGARRAFGAVAKAGKDIEMLSRRTLDAVGRTKDTALTAFTDGCPALRRVLAGRLETRHGLVHFSFMIPALWPTTNRTRNGILCGRVQNGTMNKMADCSRTAVGCPASRRRHMRRGAKYALSPSSGTARVYMSRNAYGDTDRARQHLPSQTRVASSGQHCSHKAHRVAA